MLGCWELDSATSRFAAEAEREPLIAGLKKLSAKPVVGVGRFTSPDTMVRQVRAGDPGHDRRGPAIDRRSVPAGQDRGRDSLDDIRECIGCNICISGDMTMSPIRCTQNPAMGEEWRRGWHPERIRPRESEASILIVGAGPAGLEAARALGQRGYPVMLAEATRELGGRVTREAGLPGLATWRRVAEYRIGQLDSATTAMWIISMQSEITPDDALGHGFTDILVATGARWRTDGVGRWHTSAIPIADEACILTPDDLLTGDHPLGRSGAAPQQILVFDDDHYYLGGVLAELLAQSWPRGPAGYRCPAGILVDRSHPGDRRHPAAGARKRGSSWTPAGYSSPSATGEARTACAFTGSETGLAADAVLLVTARIPRDGLFLALEQRQDRVVSVRRTVGELRGGCMGSDHDRRRRMGGPTLCGGTRHTRAVARDRNYRREYTALAAWTSAS